jgi:hypothetical protein
MARKRNAAAGATLLATTLLATALLAGCTAPGGGAAAPAAPSASAPAPPAQDERALPVYYVTDTPAGPRLAREFRRLGATTGPGTAAVVALLAEPVGRVPGHRNAWPAGTALATPVTHTGGLVTVDLSVPDAVPDHPELAVQQLVYSVTGALRTADPVRLLVDGQPIPRLWDRVDTVAPVARADPYAVRVLVGIDEPVEDASVRSPVRVAGEAAVFEATVLWEVRRDGAVVRSGSTSTTEGQRFAPYSFEVPLPPGAYEIRVAEDDPSDGAGRAVMTDSRQITVVE